MDEIVTEEMVNEVASRFAAWAAGDPEQAPTSGDRAVARGALAAVAPLIRRAALEEAAAVARNACLVPPDGGSPTEDERRVAQAAHDRILALAEKQP